MAEPSLQRAQARRAPEPARRAVAVATIHSDPVESERARIALVLARVGPEQARAWAHRTAVLYRQAVLDRQHYAHTAAYRRRFIESYLELKRFAQVGGPDGTASL